MWSEVRSIERLWQQRLCADLCRSGGMCSEVLCSGCGWTELRCSVWQCLWQQWLCADLCGSGWMCSQVLCSCGLWSELCRSLCQCVWQCR